MKAVENSATIIGLRCTDGVILASEKLTISELHEPGDNSRLFKVYMTDSVLMTLVSVLNQTETAVLPFLHSYFFNLKIFDGLIGTEY